MSEDGLIEMVFRMMSDSYNRNLMDDQYQDFCFLVFFLSRNSRSLSLKLKTEKKPCIRDRTFVTVPL